MALAPEVDLAYPLVRGDLPGRPLHQHAAADHHNDAAREAEHYVHVVLDEEHRDVARETGDRDEERRALVARHTRCRLVEQQHFRPRRERERDLEQPLLAVRELPGRPVAIRGEPERAEDPVRLVDRVAIRRQTAPPRRRVAVALADRQRHRLERVQPGEQRVDLERAREPALHSRRRRGAGDLLAAEEDLAAVRPQHAGHEVDERGLPGAVRADERVARADRHREIDAARDDERAEALVEAPRRERRRRHAAPRRHDAPSRASPPRMPFGSSKTTTTSSSPIQKYQYCGLTPENWSRATM